MRRGREAKYNITDEELRPYFSLPNVLEGLFGVRATATLPPLVLRHEILADLVVPIVLCISTVLKRAFAVTVILLVILFGLQLAKRLFDVDITAADGQVRRDPSQWH